MTEPAIEQPTLSREVLHEAWTLIANVSGGDWTQQSEEWQEAAARWRDRFHDVLDRERNANPSRYDALRRDLTAAHEEVARLRAEIAAEILACKIGSLSTEEATRARNNALTLAAEIAMEGKL